MAKTITSLHNLVKQYASVNKMKGNCGKFAKLIIRVMINCFSFVSTSESLAVLFIHKIAKKHTNNSEIAG